MPRATAAAKVAVWRQLKKVGAIYLQQSVCVFPDRSEVTAELTPLLARIAASGGEFHLLPLGTLPPDEREKLISEFRTQTAKHYAEIVENCKVDFKREIEFETFRKNFTYEEAEEIRAEFDKITAWFERVQRRDWFGAPKRRDADLWIRKCRTMLERFEAKVYERQDHGDGRVGTSRNGTGPRTRPPKSSTRSL